MYTANTLSLESFVSLVNNCGSFRLTCDLTPEDEKLVYSYLDVRWGAVWMTDEQQLFFALFILESEGR